MIVIEGTDVVSIISNYIYTLVHPKRAEYHHISNISSRSIGESNARKMGGMS
jgi:hypothetical protein